MRNSRSRLRCTNSTKPGRPCARSRQIGSNCGDASSPDSSGCKIHKRPSPSRSRCSVTAAWWATTRGSQRRIADRHPPRERQRRRLDRRGHRVVAMDHVVEQDARAIQPMVPEDRVTDKSVRPGRGQQRLKLTPGASGIEVSPPDRGKARVPVPLPPIPLRARARIGERHPLALADRPASLQCLVAALLEPGHTPQSYKQQREVPTSRRPPSRP